MYVHPKFKFVLIQDSSTVGDLDLPLLSRFEKHEFTKQSELNSIDENVFK